MTVDLEPVVALELLHGGLGRRAEAPVLGEAGPERVEPVLDDLHRRSALARRRGVAGVRPLRRDLRGSGRRRRRAEAGDLVPIVAGSRQAFEKVRQVIEKLGRTFYVGERDGSANAIKLALNLNIALVASAVSEGITLVRRAGIDPSIFIEILNSTYFKTGLSEKKGPKMVKNDFSPSFHLKNMLKDLELATNTAQGTGITLPQTALAQQIFRAANNMGFSDQDYTSICAFLAKINGLENR